MRTNRDEDEAVPLSTAAHLRRAVMRLSRRLRAARPIGTISLGKLSILGYLQARGAMTAGDLALLEQLQPQTLTRVLGELEGQGLISRTQDPADRRRAIIAITRQGSRVLSEDMRQRDSWLAETMARALTPTEHQLLSLAADLLDRLADGRFDDQMTSC
jgi:DNA-binding MarR family transcriptional regulator